MMCASAADEIGALGIATDVRDSAAVDAALARTEVELGPVTILVNNAWRRLLVGDPRHHRERLERAVQV